MYKEKVIVVFILAQKEKNPLDRIITVIQRFHQQSLVAFVIVTLKPINIFATIHAC